MAVSEFLKTLIIKTAVKDVSYDPKTGMLIINQKELNAEESAMLRAKVVEEGHSPTDFSKIISEILNSNSSIIPKVVTEYTLHPYDIKLGQHLMLIGNSSEFGITRLEIMCIDLNRFMVLDSERGSLQREDILESVTMPWNSGYKVNFKVQRNGIPFPDDLHLYQTYRLECIELLNPPVIYEYLDKSEDNTKPVIEIDLSDQVIAEITEPETFENKETNEVFEIQDMPQPSLKPDFLNIYTADKLTHSQGFKHEDLISRNYYKGGIFEICQISENEARLRVNNRQMVQDKIFGSLNLLNKACEPFKAIGEPDRIFTVKEGVLKKENDIWVIVKKMKIEFEYLRWKVSKTII